MTADELVGRPTYKEEFENVRHNVNKIIIPGMNQQDSMSQLTSVKYQDSSNDVLELNHQSTVMTHNNNIDLNALANSGTLKPMSPSVHFGI